MRISNFLFLVILISCQNGQHDGIYESFWGETYHKLEIEKDSFRYTVEGHMAFDNFSRTFLIRNDTLVLINDSIDFIPGEFLVLNNDCLIELENGFDYCKKDKEEVWNTKRHAVTYHNQSEFEIKKETNHSNFKKYADSAPNEIQQSAFDALNTLQQSTDKINHLYSTFANISHASCLEGINYEISQSELLGYMKQFVTRHCQNLKPELRNELARLSVQAQEKYIVMHCRSKDDKENISEGLRMTGTWVMPNVLGLRDVVLIW